jgi:hypothetical protein
MFVLAFAYHSSGPVDAQGQASPTFTREQAAG